MSWVNGDGTPDNFNPEDPVKSAAEEMAATASVFEKSQQGIFSAAPSVETIQQSIDPHAGMTREQKIARIQELRKAKEAEVDPVEDLEKGVPHAMPTQKTKKKPLPPVVAPTADRASAVEKGGAPPAPMSSTHLKKPEKSPIEEKQEKEALGKRPSMLKADDGSLDGLAASSKSLKKKIKKAANPFAVCHASTGPAKDAKFERCVMDVKKKEGIKKAMANPIANLDGDVDHPRPGPEMNLIGADEKTQPAPGGSSSEERENTRPVSEEKMVKAMEKARAMAESVLKKSHEGEGSKGGKVIGHTASGKPIYAPTQGHIETVKEHVNLQKRTAKGKLAEHAHAHVAHSSKDYDVQDHAAATLAHGKEARDPQNSPKVKAFHEAIAQAHGALAQGQHTPAQSESNRLKTAADKRAKAAGKKEAGRKKDVVATAPGGHKILNTHHVRNSSGFGPEGPIEGPAAGQGGKFGLKHPPIETEAGEHLTHEQHKDIAAHHEEQAHHHAVQASVHESISERIGHRKTMEQHQHAAKYHHAEAAKKKPASSENPNQGKFPFAKSRIETMGNKKLAKAMDKLDAFGGDILHKNVDHPRPGAEVSQDKEFHNDEGFEPKKKKAKKEEVRAPMLVDHNKPSLEIPEGACDDDKTPNMSGGSFVDHERPGSSMKKSKLQKAMSQLEDFAKSEGQGGMPECGVTQELPMHRRPVDGGELEGAGSVGSEAQDNGEATVSSTAHMASSTEEDNLREMAKMHDSPGVQKADLESEAGGQKLQKGSMIDWNQAADDGEFLRAQLVSQLMNKSMDVTFGVGGKVAKKAATASQEMKINAYLQKGGAAVYMDSEDQVIEKAMNRVSGTTFSQGSQANLGAPVQHETECGGCGSLVKSFLSSCTECGVSLQGHRTESQGVRMAKSVAMSLLPQDDEDVSIG